jgi:hypothetical protein
VFSFLQHVVVVKEWLGGRRGESVEDLKYRNLGVWMGGPMVAGFSHCLALWLSMGLFGA